VVLDDHEVVVGLVGLRDAQPELVVPLGEQLRRLRGSEQAGNAEELLVLGVHHDVGGRALTGVRGAAVQHVGEPGVGLQRLPLLEAVRVLLLGRQRLEVELVALHRLRRRHDMVALLLHGGGQRQQRAHRGEEHRRRLVRPAGADHAADGLGEEQRRPVGGHPGQDGGAGDVDALGDHPHADRDPGGPGGEALDLLRRLRVVGEDQLGRLSGHPADDLGVGTGVVLVAGQDQPGGVGHPGLAQMGDAVIHGGDDVRHPLALGVQCGPPGLHLHRLGAGLRQRGGDHLTGGVPPARRTRVRGEDDRPDDGVGQRLLVAVGVVGAADQPDPAVAVVALEAVLLVAHKGNALVGLGAERRPGQAQPAGGEPVGLLDRLAPREAVTGVVHLVEDHQCLDRGRAGGVQHRLAGDLRVRGHVALGAGAHRSDGVGQARVQHDAHGVGGVGPLQPQVVGRADHHDPGDLPPRQQPRGQGQGEGGLARARGRGDQEVLG
jgi:hypothetical protein